MKTNAVDFNNNNEKFEFIYNILMARLDVVRDIRKSLDNKANSIILLIGLMINFEFWFLNYMGNEIEKTIKITNVLQLLYFTISLILIVSLFYSLKACRPQEWKMDPEEDYIINYLEKNIINQDLFKTMSLDLFTSIDFNKKINRQKASYIDKSVVLLAVVLLGDLTLIYSMLWL